MKAAAYVFALLLGATALVAGVIGVVLEPPASWTAYLVSGVAALHCGLVVLAANADRRDAGGDR